MLKDIIEQKGISVYKLSKETGISYSTLNDIVIEKTDIKNVSANMLYRLAKYLDLSMEAIYEDSTSTDSQLYLYNEGRNIFIQFGRKRIQYLGPKNLLYFHRINKIEEHVISVDCYFENNEGVIYSEEDYVDLGDVLQDYPSVLEAEYQIQLGNPALTTRESVINRSLMVSDNLAIIYYVDKNIPDKCVQVTSLARLSAMAIIRLKDMAVVKTNMSAALLKRAVAAVQRNMEEIEEEIEEVSKYA